MVTLIMAGGKGKRFGGKTEKALIRLLGKPLIQWVIEATMAAEKISEVYVIATNETPKTVEAVSNMGVKVIKTEGKGYHADLQQAILDSGMEYPVLAISADMPLLTEEFLDHVISHYWKAGKPALTVLVPIEACRRHGVEPTSLYPHDGESYAVSGLNVVDGRKISEGEQEQEVLISDRIEVAININTRQDLEAAERYLREKN
jgi:adenosylcobinamide-phosphate guanylyltransferase